MNERWTADSAPMEARAAWNAAREAAEEYQRLVALSRQRQTSQDGP